MGDEEALFAHVNLVVRDMDASLTFYRRLGMPVPAETPNGPGGIQHVAVPGSQGLQLEFDSVALAQVYNASWRQAVGGTTVLLGFALPSREAVDARYAALTAAGYPGMQPPYDAFWGARYAIVEDPDGNQVGLMSPIDAEQRSWPPVDSPAP